MTFPLTSALEETILKYGSAPNETVLDQSALELSTEIFRGLSDEQIMRVVLQHMMNDEKARKISKSIANHFANLGDLFHSEVRKLKKIPGMSVDIANLLAAIKEITVRVARAEVAQSPILNNNQALKKYLQTSMGSKSIEEVRILFLNAKNYLIEDWLHGRGTVNEAPFYIKEIIKKTVDVNATALILVHNHPSGDVIPSEADIYYTKKLVAATAAIDVVLHDHLIISKKSIASFQNLGLL